jgi:SAM-dependent methyltransferase
MTINSAERFYLDSHARNAGVNPVAPLDRDSAAAELLATHHRYQCAFLNLRQYRPANVIELGFGSPKLLAALAGACGNYTIVDIVDRTGTKGLPENVSFCKADLNEDFPFADRAYDVVIAMMVVEHLFDPFHSFREIARITSKGGKAFVNLPNIGSIRCRLQLLAGRMPVTSSTDWFRKREWDGNHLHYFTVADTVRLAGLSGLKLDAVHPVGGNAWLKKARPSLLCHEISYEFTRL